ncbi:hypothetical protein [Nocardia niigatensis]
MNRTGYALTAAVLMAGVTGCMAPDRGPQVRHLQDELQTMPGVAGATVGYSNDIEHGSTVSMTLKVQHASESQIADVVSRIKTVEGDDFADYRQTIAFTVADDTVLSLSSVLNPQRVAEGARLLRQTRAALGPPPTSTGTPLTWYLGASASSLDLFDIPSPDATLDMLQTTLGDQPASVTIVPTVARAESVPRWFVDFPINRDDIQRIRGQVSEVPERLTVSAVHVKRVHIAELEVEVVPYSAGSALRGTIAAAHPTRDNPLLLEWRERYRDPRSSEPAFSGSVDVAGCSSDDPRDDRGISKDSLALQRTLRSEFETCGK